MFYWLYTQAQPVFSSVFLPLLCLTFILPVVLSLVLGRGIQRSDEGSQMTAPGWRALAQLITFFVVVAAVDTLYLSITRGAALSPRAGAKQPTNEILLLLAGGPDTINKSKLLSLGMFALFLTLMTCII